MIDRTRWPCSIKWSGRNATVCEWSSNMFLWCCTLGRVPEHFSHNQPHLETSGIFFTSTLMLRISRWWFSDNLSYVLLIPEVQICDIISNLCGSLIKWKDKHDPNWNQMEALLFPRWLMHHPRPREFINFKFRLRLGACWTGLLDQRLGRKYSLFVSSEAGMAEC